jgi:hypothetical protein
LNRHHLIGETADVQTDIGFARQSAAPLITDSDNRLTALEQPQQPGTDSPDRETITTVASR